MKKKAKRKNRAPFKEKSVFVRFTKENFAKSKKEKGKTT